MEHLKEDFFKTYSNIPINLRNNIILVLDGGGPISWDVAYFAIKNDTESSQAILTNLKELNLI